MSEAATNAEFSVPGAAGAALLAERRRQGLSLGDISRQLKLSVRQVEALERDDYSGFSGPVFVHGFIRNYAKLLNLDPDRLIRAADQILNPPALASEPLARGCRTADRSAPQDWNGAGGERRRGGCSVSGDCGVARQPRRFEAATAGATRHCRGRAGCATQRARAGCEIGSRTIGHKTRRRQRGSRGDGAANHVAHGLRPGILGGNQGSQRQHHLRATQPGGQSSQRQR